MSGRRRRIVDDDDDDSDSDDEGGIPFTQDRDRKIPDFFNYYFPGISYNRNIEKMIRKVRSCVDDFLICSLKPKHVRNAHSFYLDYAYWPQWVKKEFKSNPDLIISSLQICIHWKEDLEEGHFVKVRVLHYQHSYDIEHLTTKLTNRFIRVKGTVLRTSDISPMIKSMLYTCVSCFNQRRQSFKHGKVFPPKKCRCGGGKFYEHRDSVQDQFFQTIRIQGGDNVNLDSTPMDIQVELTADLVGQAIPGEQVEIGGIVRVMSLEEKFGGARRRGGRRGGGGGGFQTDKKMFMFLEGNSLIRENDTSMIQQQQQESIGQGNNNNNNNISVTQELMNQMTQLQQVMSDEDDDEDDEDDDNERGGRRKKKKKKKKKKLMFSTNSEFTVRELAAIKAIQKEDNIFQLIVHSLCPTIFGMEIIKSGLALSLFGGNRRRKNSSTSIRGDPHILLVGDPGLGKSQLLLSMSKVTPRGIYVCSKVTTTRGLTVTVLRDSKTGEYAMEAGALVLADQGTCCIDEFDKLQKDDFKALLEAMEQQTVSIAKAGICCTIPTRCSVVAAANPVGGRYTRSKTVAENIRMMPAMLSRFDLVFVLLDTKDERRDDLLANYVVNMHSEVGREIKNAKSGVKWEEKNIIKRSRKKKGNQEEEEEEEDDDDDEEEEGSGGRNSFGSSHAAYQRDFYKLFQENERRKGDKADQMFDNVQQVQDMKDKHRFRRLRDSLMLSNPEEFDPLPPQLLKIYIRYARKNVFPVLSSGAKDVLKNFFMSLRKVHQCDDSTPITTRQLESLIRLSEARARVELRSTVTVQDAWDVIEIMKESMYDLLVTDEGHLDFRRSTGTIKGKSESKFVRVLERRARKKGRNVFKRSELLAIIQDEQIHIKGRNVDAFIDRLNLQGFLLLAGNGKYRLTTVSVGGGTQ